MLSNEDMLINMKLCDRGAEVARKNKLPLTIKCIGRMEAEFIETYMKNFYPDVKVEVEWAINDGTMVIL